MNADNDPRSDDEIELPKPPDGDVGDEVIRLEEPDETPTPSKAAPPLSAQHPPSGPASVTEKKSKPETGAADKPKTDEAPLVRPGLGGPKAALIVGVALLVGAMIAAALRISGLEGAGFADSTLAVFYVLFQTLLHTMTGLAALLIAAKVAGRELGKAELGLARMLAAVGAFALVANLNIPIPGRIDELALAALAYTLVVWLVNRLSRMEVGVVVLAHAMILIVVALGSLLDGAYADAKSTLGPPRAREAPAAETTPADPGPADPGP